MDNQNINNNNIPQERILNNNIIRGIAQHGLEIQNNNNLKNVLEIKNSILYTKNCHKVSLGIIIFIIFWIIYLFNLMNYQSFSIMKLESEDGYFWIIIWMINAIIIIISWNIFVFVYTTIFNYKYTNGNGAVRTSFVEEFYKSPFGYILLLYYFKNSYLNNAIDNSMWITFALLYSFLYYNLVQFFKQFDSEINNISDFKSQESLNILKKMRTVTIIFTLATLFITLINYSFIIVLPSTERKFFVAKGVFILLKLYELFITRKSEFYFLSYSIEEKEKSFIDYLNKKAFCELTTMIFLYYQIIVVLLYGECKPFYFTLVILYFIVVLGYQGILYFKKHSEAKDYFKNLDKSLEKVILVKEEECIICTEKLKYSRKLSCNHYFHLLCLSKWFEKGHKNCPICRAPINLESNVNNYIQNMHNNENEQNNSGNSIIRRIFSFCLRSGLLSWLPNISLRIIRYNNNPNNIILDQGNMPNNIIIRNNGNEINLNLNNAGNNMPNNIIINNNINQPGLNLDNNNNHMNNENNTINNIINNLNENENINNIGENNHLHQE